VSKQGVLSNEAVQGRLRVQVKDREQILDAALAGIMSSPDGRMVMHYLVYTLFGLESVCLDADPRMANLWEGRRWGAKMLRELLERTAPEQVSAMLTEALAQSKKQQSAAKAVTNLDDGDNLDA
jgi:hypothetical protein